MLFSIFLDCPMSLVDSPNNPYNSSLSLNIRVGCLNPWLWKLLFLYIQYVMNWVRLCMPPYSCHVPSQRVYSICAFVAWLIDNAHFSSISP